MKTLRARGPLTFVVGALLLGVLAAACATTGGDDDEGAVPGRIPFGCGEIARYSLEEIDGTRVATGTLETRCEGDAWLLTQHYTAAGAAEGDVVDASQVVAHITTLAPASSSREATRDGEVERWDAAYTADRSAVTFTRVEPDGDSDERELRLRENAYDNESALWLWRALPLDEEYDERYVSVSAVSRNQITVRLTVVQQERIEVPAGTFETWRLQVRSGRATRVAWIGIDPPYPLVQWDNGDQIFLLEGSSALR
jgi:hypothetical protein